MIKLIVGNKGSGKTKTLIDMINNSAKTTTGNIVCIEKGMQMTYNIDYSVRLIDIANYDVSGFDMFYGFITGVLAGNYDITEIFVDATLRIGGRNMEELAAMIEKLDKVSESSKVSLVFTVSCDVSDLPESIKKFVI
ncbi:MAG: hypothetical protein SOX72_01000 [Oscillospiraceae bacterium]|jgi:ABC-type cobalamin/Fe3+-siderophores transport system ATPase subunit|nr:hypothetical protein [Oscillospiraceae bacterium]MDY4190782.1 hypothetical protein [Oscillospiraceae bacterium]